VTTEELKRHVDEMARYLSEENPTRKELELRLVFYQMLLQKRERKAA